MGFVNTSLCVTPECVTASSNILQNLAPNYQSIDPCEDFDQCLSQYIQPREASAN